MGRRIVNFVTLTPGVFADTVDMTNGQYPFVLLGGISTQINKIWEISIAGQAASVSSPTFMILSRDSQVGSGANSNGTGQTDAAIDPATVAIVNPPITGSIFVTNKPQRSSTLHMANCTLNAYGGDYFWRANRIEECFSTLGNTASFGEMSLSAFTGSIAGACGSHVIYEPL